MKILTFVKPNAAAPTPWWAGKTAVCQSCALGVELEAGDSVTATAPPAPGTVASILAPCPNPKCAGNVFWRDGTQSGRREDNQSEDSQPEGGSPE